VLTKTENFLYNGDLQFEIGRVFRHKKLKKRMKRQGNEPKKQKATEKRKKQKREKRKKKGEKRVCHRIRERV